MTAMTPLGVCFLVKAYFGSLIHFADFCRYISSSYAFPCLGAAPAAPFRVGMILFKAALAPPLIVLLLNMEAEESLEARSTAGAAIRNYKSRPVSTRKLQNK